MTINKLEKNLKEASRAQIITNIRKLLKDSSPDIIPLSNSCRNVQKLKGTEDPGEVANYISSLSLVHCLDAWKYLSRAFQAISRGDNATACHLAYYAELRSVLSILASEGIAVYRGGYAILKDDDSNGCYKMEGETAKIAFQILPYLCSYTDFGKTLARIASFGGYNLNEFIEEIGYGQETLNAFWSRTLQQWGIDLHIMNDDQERRNITSYLPNWFIRDKHASFKEVVEFTLESWEILEYSSPDFLNFDRDLFKKTLEGLRSSRNWNQSKYFKELDRVLKSKGIQKGHTLYTFLHKDFSNPILELANNKKENIFPGFEKCVLARALLLSRISLGSVKQLLIDGEPPIQGIDEVLVDYGKRHGMFDNGEGIEKELSVELTAAIESTRKWYKKTGILTPHNLNSTLLDGANIINSFERVPIEVLAN